jgi:hypothetical protein
LGSIRSSPAMYGCTTFGIVTDPSASW